MTCDEAVAALALAPRGAAAEPLAHAASCARCAAELSAARRVGAVLAAEPPPLPMTGQIERTLAAAAPLLARRRAAARARRRRLVRALVVSLVPLPAIVLLDLQLVRALHALVAPVLPPALSGYLVASLGALLALLLALAYAMVPLVAGRLGAARTRRPFALAPTSVPDRPDPEEAHA